MSAEIVHKLKGLQGLKIGNIYFFNSMESVQSSKKSNYEDLKLQITSLDFSSETSQKILTSLDLLKQLFYSDEIWLAYDLIEKMKPYFPEYPELVKNCVEL